MCSEEISETTTLYCDGNCKLEIQYYQDSVVESWLTELSCNNKCNPQIDYVTHQPYIYQQECCTNHVCVWKTENNRLFLDNVQRPVDINPATTSHRVSTSSYSTPAVSETLLTSPHLTLSDAHNLNWETCKLLTSHFCNNSYSAMSSLVILTLTLALEQL